MGGGPCEGERVGASIHHTEIDGRHLNIRCAPNDWGTHAQAAGPSPPSTHVPLPFSVQPLAHLQVPLSQRPCASQVSTPDTTQLPPVGAGAARQEGRILPRTGGRGAGGVDGWTGREACNAPFACLLESSRPTAACLACAAPQHPAGCCKGIVPPWDPQERLQALTLALAR
jgi:hypothetical protein